MGGWLCHKTENLLDCMCRWQGSAGMGAGARTHARRNLVGRVGTLPKKSEKSAGGRAHRQNFARIYCLLLNSAGGTAPMFAKVLRAGRALCPQSLKKQWTGAPADTILPVPAILGRWSCWDRNTKNHC